MVFEYLKESVNGMVDAKVRKELENKGYEPNVIEALVRFGPKTLWSLDNIDDNTFGRLANQNPGGKSGEDLKLFRDAAESLRRLGRTNPAFAEAVANRYQANPKKYENDAKTFANQMYADPALCRKVIELTQSQSITELEKLAKDPAGYMERLAVRAPASGPAPAPGTSSTPPPPGGPSGASGPGGQRGRRQPSGTPPAPPVAAAPAPLPSTADDRLSPGESSGDDYTADEAQAKFGKWMADPKNEKLAKKIAEKEGLREQIEAKLREHPNLVRNFMAKGNVAMYQMYLDRGDVSGFMNEFAGPVVTGNMPDFSGMSGNFLGSAFESIQSFLGPLFGGMFGDDRHAGFFTSFMGALKGSDGTAKTASTGTGEQILKLFQSGDSKKEVYAIQLMGSLESNVRAPRATGSDVKDPDALAKHGQRAFEAMGLTPEQIAALRTDGHTHVDVVRDKDGRVVRGQNDKPTFTVVKSGSIDEAVQKMDEGPTGTRPIRSPQIETRPLESTEGPKGTDWEAERRARDERERQGLPMNIPGMSPTTTV